MPDATAPGHRPTPDHPFELQQPVEVRPGFLDRLARGYTYRGEMPTRRQHPVGPLGVLYVVRRATNHAIHDEASLDRSGHSVRVAQPGADAGDDWWAQAEWLRPAGQVDPVPRPPTLGELTEAPVLAPGGVDRFEPGHTPDRRPHPLEGVLADLARAAEAVLAQNRARSRAVGPPATDVERELRRALNRTREAQQTRDAAPLSEAAVMAEAALGVLGELRLPVVSASTAAELVAAGRARWSRSRWRILPPAATEADDALAAPVREG